MGDSLSYLDNLLVKLINPFTVIVELPFITLRETPTETVRTLCNPRASPVAVGFGF